MTTFKNLSEYGLSEAMEELGEGISVDTLPGITIGSWQETDEGKELQSNDGGFLPDQGGSLVIAKGALSQADIKALSGRIVTRTATGQKRRITEVQQTRIALVCTLSPITR